MNNKLTAVETACQQLASNKKNLTFTAVADQTGISRTTLYRNPELRAVIQEHQQHATDPRTITSLASEIAHLRTGLQALGDRLRQQEERIRQLETPNHQKTG